MQIESDEGEQEGGDDGDGSTTSTDGARAERVADDHVALDGDRNDEPDGVVADGVQRRRTELARPLRQRLHVHAPRLRRPSVARSPPETRRKRVKQASKS